MFQSALDRGVEGVQAVKRQRLGGGETPRSRAARPPGAARPGFRAVVREHAVKEGQPPLGGQLLRSTGDHLRADRQMAQQPALVADREFRPVGELARLADVVNERRRHQQVGVQPGMELAQVADQRPDGDRVLQQPAEVGVMPAPGAGCAAELAGLRPGEDKPLDDAAQAGIVDLAAQVLEEALELLHRAIGGGQELGGVERAGVQSSHLVELGRQLAPEALQPAANQHRVAALEAQPDPVGLAEYASRNRARAVAQLDGQVRAPVPGRQAVLAHACVAALEALTGAQLGDRGLRPLRRRNRHRRFHTPIVKAAADGSGRY